MKVRFKKLNPAAVTPTYAKAGDAGLDLTAISIKETPLYVQYNTGIAIEIPEHHVGLLFPRSSVTDLPLMMKNCVGVIDSGYRGEIKARFQVLDYSNDELFEDIPTQYNVGDRVAQLIIVPIPPIELEETEELSDSHRGVGGYGSTGK